MHSSTGLVLLGLAALAAAQQSSTTMSPNGNMQNGGRGQRPTPSPQQIAQWEAQKQAYIATLSTAAQSAARQIDQLKQQIDQIYNSQTASVQQELDGIHKMGGKGGRGGMPMNNSNNGNNNNANQGR